MSELESKLLILFKLRICALAQEKGLLLRLQLDGRQNLFIYGFFFPDSIPYSLVNMKIELMLGMLYCIFQTMIGT